MKKLTFKEILDILESKITPIEFINEDFDSSELNLGEVITVQHYGGSGKGETYYTVFHFVEHDVYIKADGYYSSYNGAECEWSDCIEVKPITKTITVYE